MIDLLASLFCLSMLLGVIVVACWDVNRDHKPPTPRCFVPCDGDDEDLRCVGCDCGADS